MTEETKLPERVDRALKFVTCPVCEGHPQKGVGACPHLIRVSERIIMSTAKYEALLELLDDLADGSDCEWDHNHSCQAHGFYYIPQGQKCPVQEAKDLIAEEEL